MNKTEIKRAIKGSLFEKQFNKRVAYRNALKSEGISIQYGDVFYKVLKDDQIIAKFVKNDCKRICSDWKWID